MTVVMVDVPWVPCIMLTEAGEAAMENPDPAVTVNVTVVALLESIAIARDGDGITTGRGVSYPTLMVICELPEPGAGIEVED